MHSTLFNKTFKSGRIFVDPYVITKFLDMVDDSLLQSSFDPKSQDIIALSPYHKKDILEKIKNAGLMCNYARKGIFSINPDGRIAKCEECDQDSIIIGYLSDEGIKYTKDICSIYDDLESEECSVCIAYPLCGSMSCVKCHKCNMVKSELEKIIKYIQKDNIL